MVAAREAAVRTLLPACWDFRAEPAFPSPSSGRLGFGIGSPSSFPFFFPFDVLNEGAELGGDRSKLGGAGSVARALPFLSALPVDNEWPADAEADIDGPLNEAERDAEADALDELGWVGWVLFAAAKVEGGIRDVPSLDPGPPNVDRVVRL